jgi:elongation factor Ts
MEITTEMIKELRAATNAGILDCRKALTEANGDFQKAVTGCAKKAWQIPLKRADRVASQVLWNCIRTAVDAA